MSISAIWLSIKGFAKASPLLVYFIGFLVVLLLFIIIPNAGSIYEFFGFDTKESLRAKSEKQELIINQLKATVDQNTKELKKQKELNEYIINVLKEQKDFQDKSVYDTNKKIEDKNKQITSIIDNKNIPVKQQHEMISQLIQKTVWDSFCSYNPDHDTCKTTK